MLTRRFSFGLIAVLAASVICIPTMTAMAQESEAEIPSAEHSLQGGAWALQFQVGSNFDLRPFRGFGVAGKYQLSKNRAIRIGAEIGLLTSSGDFQTYYGDQDGQATSGEASRDLSDFNLTGEYVLYPSVAGKMNLYVGGGPQIGFMFEDWQAEITDADSTNGLLDKDRIREYAWTFGLSIICGGEWFAARNISLFGEYSVSAGYEWEKSRMYDYYPDRRTREESMSSLFLRQDWVKLGLSLYF